MSKAASTDSIQLRSLAPEYLETQHQTYLDALKEALAAPEENKIRNIALSGSYGTGKSSILDKLASELRQEAVKLSLSNLWNANDLDNEAKSERPGSREAANRIQKEIVKQLLYSQPAAVNSASRFRRIEPFNRLRAVKVSIFLGAVLTVIQYFFDIRTKTEDLAKDIIGLLPELCGIDLAQLAQSEGFVLITIWAVVSLGIYAFSSLFHGRLHMTQLSAKAGGSSAAISRDDKTTSYFDQYLDEIVYFFETQKTRVVIFEDIDRFNNHHIFEELRALNELLNSVKGSKPIQFIYAIKDSIFEAPLVDQKGTDELSSPVTNRTKFFDLIIPVVPFITHRNARDLMRDETESLGHAISKPLIDLAARHLPDMRLIKNIRNEFEVFYKQIITDNAALKLDPDLLFAMMLYKSNHLTDFENIRVGKSKLDRVYEASRALVNQNIKQLNREALALKVKASALDSVEARLGELNTKFEEFVQQVVRIGQLNAPQVREVRGAHHATVYDSIAEITKDFWKDYLNAPAPITVTVCDQYGNGLRTLAFSVEDVIANLGLPASLQEWEVSDKEKLILAAEVEEADATFLETADFDALIKRHDLTFSGDDTGGPIGLRAYAQRELSSLGFDLMQAGYITRDFALYTTNFYDVSLSPAAMNFMMHNIDADKADHNFQLTEDDVRTLVAERGSSIFGRPALYNIAVLNALIKIGGEPLETILKSLAEFGQEAQEFLGVYLRESEKNRVPVVRRLTVFGSGVMPYLVSEFENEEILPSLVDAALCSLVPRKSYKVDSGVTNWIENNYENLPALCSKSLSPDQIKNTVAYLDSAKVRIKSLSALSDELVHELAAVRCFVITRENMSVLGSGAVNPLDEMPESVCQYCLENIPAYLSCLEDGDVAISSEDGLVEVVEQFPVEKLDELDRVLVKTYVRLKDLPSVHDDYYQSLARAHCFKPDVGNVSEYLKEKGLDTDLVSFLNAERAIGYDQVEEEGRQALAIKLAAEAQKFEEPVALVEILDSLDLDEYLPIEVFNIEHEQLAGLLIASQIVADNEDTFNKLRDRDWVDREFAISKSEKFSSFVAPQHFGGSELNSLFASRLISDEVKNAVIGKIEMFLQDAPLSSLAAVANYAIQKNVEFSPSALLTLVQKGVSAEKAVELIAASSLPFARDDMASILVAMGEPYSALAEKGRETVSIDGRISKVELFLNKLKQLGFVTSTKEAMLGTKIRVHRKRT